MRIICVSDSGKYFYEQKNFDKIEWCSYGSMLGDRNYTNAIILCESKLYL